MKQPITNLLLLWCAFSLPCCADNKSDAGDGQQMLEEIDGLSASCPAHAAPVPPAGTVITVGEGNPADCTGTALATAVAQATQNEGGGTVLFDCGSDFTLELDETIFIDGTLIIDGDNQIVISGKNAVRVFELANYTDLTVQRLTIADGRADESGAGILHPWYGALHASTCVSKTITAQARPAKSVAVRCSRVD